MRVHAGRCSAALLFLPCLLLATAASARQADPVADRAREAREELVPVPLDARERAFVAFAVDRSRLKGQAMEIAMQRSPSPELQVLAETMHEEHLALTEALLALAGRDSPATVTDAADHAELVELREVPAERFDARFIALLRGLHAETARRYRELVADPQAGERLRRHARDALPVIELHRRLLDDAEALLADAARAAAGADDHAIADADADADAEATADDLDGGDPQPR
jgi:predicted outer membrane protein